MGMYAMELRNGSLFFNGSVCGHIRKHKQVDGFEVVYSGKPIGCVCPLGGGDFALLVYGLSNRLYVGARVNYDVDLSNAILKLVEIRKE